MKLAILFLMLLSMGACSFDYSSTNLEDDLSAEVPDTVLRNAVHMMVRNGSNMKIESELVENYSKRNITVLHAVHFIEFNADGEITTEGWADKAIYHTDSEDAEVSGSVIFYSAAQETTIFAEDLSWESETSRLTSPRHQSVMVRRDDGSAVEGKGFQADLKRKRITFESGGSGQYVAESAE